MRHERNNFPVPVAKSCVVPSSVRTSRCYGMLSAANLGIETLSGKTNNMTENGIGLRDDEKEVCNVIVLRSN